VREWRSLGVGLLEQPAGLPAGLPQAASGLIPVDLGLLPHLGRGPLCLGALGAGFHEQLVGMFPGLLNDASCLLPIDPSLLGELAGPAPIFVHHLRRVPLGLGSLCLGLLEELTDLLSVDLVLSTREVVQPALDLSGLELDGINLEL
jgi:hypothetical protein